MPGIAKLRPIVLVGDGAFQANLHGVIDSLFAQRDSTPWCWCSTTRGYTTERFLQDGPFSDIPLWNYHRLPDLFRGGWGFEIFARQVELDQSLKAALENKDAFSLLNIHLEPDDVSPALVRLTKRLAKRL